METANPIVITDIIALLALVTSVVSLTYTMIVDRRRPKLQVRGKITREYIRSPLEVKLGSSYFNIRATNLGPGRVCVNGIVLSHRNALKRLYRRYILKNSTEGMVLEALPKSPDQLPNWLEMGESLSLFYPKESDMLEEHEMFDCFYLLDSLGGKHWAQKRVFEEARNQIN